MSENRISRLRRFAADDRSLFVMINVAVNLLFLVRSYVMMLVLDYRDLGLVALLQSIVLLIGMLQFGFLNGGYRLMCSAENTEARRINNLVYTFMGGLGIVTLALAFVALKIIADPGDGWIGVLGVGGGIATLVRTWMTNQMIALGRLPRLNHINLWSALASLALLLFIPLNPIGACLAAIVAQPLIFAGLVYFLEPWARPDAMIFPPDLVRRVLVAGFAIFLSGMLLQANTQLERWYVVGFLGLDALGHLFLVIMFATLFQLAPNSLDAVFLPRLVQAYSSGEGTAVSRIVRKYFLALMIYCLGSAAALVFFAEPVVRLLLPRYVEDLTYVYLMAPGLMLLALASAFSITFSVLIQYRLLLAAYAVGTLVLASIFVGSSALGHSLSLSGVTVLRSAVLALTALFVFAGWMSVTRAHREFRFSLFEPASPRRRP